MKAELKMVKQDPGSESSLRDRMADLLLSPITRAQEEIGEICKAGERYVKAIELATFAKVAQTMGGTYSQADLDAPSEAILDIIAAVEALPGASAVLHAMFGAESTTPRASDPAANDAAAPEPADTEEAIEQDESTEPVVISAKQRFPNVSHYVTSHRPMLVLYCGVARAFDESVKRLLQAFTSHVEWKGMQRGTDIAGIVSRIRNKGYTAVILAYGGMPNTTKNPLLAAVHVGGVPIEQVSSLNRSSLLSAMEAMDAKILQQYGDATGSK